MNLQKPVSPGNCRNRHPVHSRIAADPRGSELANQRRIRAADQAKQRARDPVCPISGYAAPEGHRIFMVKAGHLSMMPARSQDRSPNLDHRLDDCRAAVSGGSSLGGVRSHQLRARRPSQLAPASPINAITRVLAIGRNITFEYRLGITSWLESPYTSPSSPAIFSEPSRIWPGSRSFINCRRIAPEPNQ